MEIIQAPWPWYVSGPIIALIMVLLIFSGKTFGMSANLRTMCSIGGGGKFAEFFRFDWKSQMWNLIVVAGSIIGGFVAAHYLSNDTPIALNETTIAQLESMGFKNPGATYVPPEIFNFTNPTSILIMVVGGILIGFGARYAGGCTSGHAISGLSDLQLPSLIAVIGFFIGGLIMTHFIIPQLF